MARLYVFLFLLIVMLTVFALISCLSAEKGEVRGVPRTVWAFIIVLLPLFGALLYFALGRPARAGTTSTWRAATGMPDPAKPRRALAPDDDPDFLARFDHQGKRADEDMLRRWEEDLLRRDDEKPDETRPASDASRKADEARKTEEVRKTEEARKSDEARKEETRKSEETPPGDG